VTDDPRTAVIFPGQGSQEPGMRELVAEHAPDLLERCERLVGADAFGRVDESTRFAQPAIFCAGVASWRAAGGTRPGAVAGHSLGELTALVAAGALDAEAGLELVVLRGELMADAAQRTGGGTMLALLKAQDGQAERLAAAHGAVVANDNAPGQLVLSGPREALATAAAQARAEGARAIELGVAGAFHSPAMAPAAEPFAAALGRTSFHAPEVPVLSCLTAAPMTDPARALAEGLTRPVHWRQTLRALADRGVQRFREAAPGTVLTKLARRTLPDAQAGPLEAAGG